MIQYKPLAHPEVELAVVVTEVNDVPASVRIYLKSRTIISTPLTYITSNALEQEVLSRAGLPETYTLGTYALVASAPRGSLYFYTLSADVTT